MTEGFAPAQGQPIGVGVRDWEIFFTRRTQGGDASDPGDVDTGLTHDPDYEYAFLVHGATTGTLPVISGAGISGIVIEAGAPIIAFTPDNGLNVYQGSGSGGGSEYWQAFADMSGLSDITLATGGGPTSTAMKWLNAGNNFTTRYDNANNLDFYWVIARRKITQ